MILLLRRGRRVESSDSSVEIDETLNLPPAQVVRRFGHFASWRPPVEVFETDRDLVVRAEIGGLLRTEVEVLVSREEFVIRGERSLAQPSGTRRYHESRVQYGSFEAAVRLPFPVAADSAIAEYIDGFVSVTLPRLAASTVAGKADGRTAGAL